MSDELTGKIVFPSSFGTFGPHMVRLTSVVAIERIPLSKGQSEFICHLATGRRLGPLILNDADADRFAFEVQEAGT